jgi:DNA modification methylase
MVKTIGNKSKADLGTFALSSEDEERLTARIKSTAIELVPTTSLKPNPRNAKRHPEQQIVLLAENICRFGIYTSPILIDEDSMILAGHARHQAARRLNLDEVPAIRLTHLTDLEKRGLALADNKIAERGEWDIEILAAELKEMTAFTVDLGFDIELTGFDTVDIDRFLGDEPVAKKQDAADDIPAVEAELPAVTKPGDIWTLGRHRLVCGDALLASTYRSVLSDERARFVFADPPYNVPISGHVTSRDGVREFVMASGEMTSDEFITFLRNIAAQIAEYTVPGAVIDICMDWSHLEELFAATRHVLGRPKNLAVWVKPNGGMRTFYRSRHELIAIYVKAGAQHVNNFRLGRRGRFRTNVWEYPGVNSLGANRGEMLSMHPTVKPVSMVADAIRDCSERGDIVLDPFGGSGTTLIACEKTGRIGRLIEIDPLYCDVILRRFERFTGDQARLAETNETFSEVSMRRAATKSEEG